MYFDDYNFFLTKNIKTIFKNAEINGDFEKDDKKYKENLKMFYLKIMDID